MLYFVRWGQRQEPLLVARVGNRIVVAARWESEAGWGWFLAEGGAELGLTQADLRGIAGPSELHEHMPAMRYQPAFEVETVGRCLDLTTKGRE